MDFFVNYYVYFLLEHQIPFVAGFFLWHLFVFICILVLISVLVPLAFILDNFIHSLIKKEKFSFASLKENFLMNVPALSIKDKPAKERMVYYALTAFVMFSVFLLWFIIPFGNYIYPLKTDIGLLLFLIILIAPIAGNLFRSFIYKNNENNLIKKSDMLLALVPLFFSAVSVVILSGSYSFRDIILNQTSYGVFSLYCFPAFISVLIFAVVISYLFQISSEFFCKYKEFYFADLYSKYSYFIVLSAFTVILFFGGYLPSLISDSFTDSYLLYGIALSFEQIMILTVKTLLFFSVIAIVSYKKDLSKFRTKILNSYIPVSIINLFIVCIISYMSRGFYAF